MGNCCGGQSKDNFSGAGRTLGATPAPAAAAAPSRASVPAKVGGPRRTLGGGGSSGSGNGDDGENARSAAARAAEARATAQMNAPKGKIGKALQEQKRQSRTNTLEAAAREEREARAQDENLQALQHN